MVRLSPFAIVLFLSACASNTYPSHAAENALVQHRTSWIAKTAVTGAPLVYASSGTVCGGCVLAFRQDTGQLVEFITISDPSGLATDSAGTLYVASNFDNGDFGILEFAPGSLDPKSFLEDTELPVNVAVAGDGTVFVSNSGPIASIFVYAHGSNRPTSQLLDINASQGFGIALDAHDNVYWGIATVSGFQIDKFVHGTKKPVNLGITLAGPPQTIAFDKGGHLMVTQPTVPVIDIVKLPNALIGQFGRTGAPLGIAHNAFHSVFVADGANHVIEQYDYPSGTLKKTISTPNFFPIGIAVFPLP